MKRLFDTICYFIDYFKYRKTSNNLFWFKLHHGFNWIKGQNFGDYLSFVIIGELLRRKKKVKYNLKLDGRKLLSLGSILHFAKNGDIIWGTGINGKISFERLRFDDLDVRMLRGPLTKKILQKRGITTGSTFGDPALLLPFLFPNLLYKPIKGKKIIIPNYNELKIVSNQILGGFTIVSPLNYWKRVVNEILTSELVLSSSLHGIVISEAFGVPVRFVMPVGGETMFKYEDYYQGTGRNLKDIPSTFLNTINEKSGIGMPEPVFNISEMLKTFPYDIFTIE